MPFWPVAAREARAAARAPRTYAWRAAVTAIGIAIVPISLWTSRASPSQGRALFIAIGAMAFCYCLFGGVLRTADAIAEEKRENTLGLLFLTDLKVGDVISGKLLASTASLFFGLLALLPLLTIPTLLGGVTSKDLVRMALCLINSLFFSISVGLLVSTFLRQGWATICFGLAAILSLVLGPAYIGLKLPYELRLTAFTLSPGAMFGVIVFNPPDLPFWRPFTATHCLAWLSILFTAHLLPKFWQERPRTARTQARFETARRLRFGSATTRKRFRTRLLNRNPLFWLSGREQVSSMGLMGFLMFLVALSLSGPWQQILCGMIAMHATLLVRMSSAASHALAEDRKSGALELLLATELSVREVLKGRWMALGRQFFGPMLIVTIWHLFTILWLSVMSPLPGISRMLAFALGGFVAAWIATGWFGMWMGLRARHPIAAIWGTFTAVVLLPWVMMTGLFSMLAFFQLIPEYGNPGQHQFEIAGFLIWIVYLTALMAWTSHRVKNAFREAATDRFSDTQPFDWRPAWRLTWKIAVVVAVIIGGVWSTRTYLNRRGERSLEAVLVAHPNFSLTEPAQPYIPDEQNLAAWDFLRPLNSLAPMGGAFSNLNVGVLTAWRTGGRYIPLPSMVRDSHTDQKNEKELTRLHAAAAERASVRFASAPAGAWHLAQPYYMRIGEVPARLAVRAEMRLHESEHPVDDILLGLRLANSLTNDPQAMLARATATAQIIQPIYDGILDERWGESELQQIQNAFEQSDTLEDFEFWRQYVIREVVNAAANRPRQTTMFGPMYLVIATAPLYIGPPPSSTRLPGKIKQDQAEIIEYGFSWTRKTGMRPNASRSRSGGPEDYKEILFEAIRFSLRDELTKLAPLQARLDQVAAACAIERFRRAEGRLPKTLEELSPKYLRKIPIDPITGRPQVYRLTSDGYILYSFGADGIDHGGIPEREETTMREGKGHAIFEQRQTIPGDWVWIYKK